MRAIRQYEFGPAENLRYEEVSDPHPAEGQVRIAVAVAGVHLIDASIREGAATGLLARPELPMTPGREVAGVVDELGAAVPEHWLGKRVVAHLGAANGGYAELAVVDSAALHELPDHVDDETAVAMIGTGRTTMAILQLAELTADDVVLVTAAAGGIGSLAVQAARNVGATVVGVAGGAEKVAGVRRLDATYAVDYTAADWVERVRDALGERQISVVLDGVGGTLGRAAMELLGIGGRLILFGYSAGEPTRLTADDLFRFGITASAAIGPRLLRRRGGLRPLEEQALAEAASGRLTPVVNPPFALADAPAAHTAITTRATVGKVVLNPAK